MASILSMLLNSRKYTQQRQMTVSAGLVSHCEHWMLPKNPPSIMLDGFKGTFDQLFTTVHFFSTKW